MRKLVVVLVDPISELTTEKDLLYNSLDIFQDEKISMVTQIYSIEKQIIVLEAEKSRTKGKDKKSDYYSF